VPSDAYSISIGRARVSFVGQAGGYYNQRPLCVPLRNKNRKTATRSAIFHYITEHLNVSVKILAEAVRRERLFVFLRELLQKTYRFECSLSALGIYEG